jgi:hypothetical protein
MARQQAAQLRGNPVDEFLVKIGKNGGETLTAKTPIPGEGLLLRLFLEEPLERRSCVVGSSGRDRGFFLDLLS